MLAEELLKFVNTTIRQKAESQTVEVKAENVDCPECLYAHAFQCRTRRAFV